MAPLFNLGCRVGESSPAKIVGLFSDPLPNSSQEITKGCLDIPQFAQVMASDAGVDGGIQRQIFSWRKGNLYNYSGLRV